MRWNFFSGRLHVNSYSSWQEELLVWADQQSRSRMLDSNVWLIYCVYKVGPFWFVYWVPSSFVTYFTPFNHHQSVYKCAEAQIRLMTCCHVFLHLLLVFLHEACQRIWIISHYHPNVEICRHNTRALFFFTLFSQMFLSLKLHIKVKLLTPWCLLMYQTSLLQTYLKMASTWKQKCDSFHSWKINSAVKIYFSNNINGGVWCTWLFATKQW